MANNTGPAFTEGYNWFTVLGVYFPTVTGVMAGISNFPHNLSVNFSPLIYHRHFLLSSRYVW